MEQDLLARAYRKDTPDAPPWVFTCPECGSDDHAQTRKSERRQRWLGHFQIREYMCRSCGSEFATYQIHQKVVSNEVATILLDVADFTAREEVPGGVIKRFQRNHEPRNGRKLWRSGGLDADTDHFD